MGRFFFVALLLAATSARADDLDPGARLFGLHCAVCHGRDAMGGGTMASALTIAPPDLTQLSASNGGVFPLEKVIGQIDGRAELPGHGGSMPVYGWFFDAPEVAITAPDGATAATSALIADIVIWLHRQQTSK